MSKDTAESSTSVQTYRGTTVKMELSDKVRFDIAVSDDFVDPTITALCEGARTGEVGDGKIFVLPLERAVRIRTGETDQAAVTPVGVPDAETINTGDTAWMLMATALVLLHDDRARALLRGPRPQRRTA